MDPNEENCKDTTQVNDFGEAGVYETQNFSSLRSKGVIIKKLKGKSPRTWKKLGYFLRVDFCPSCYGLHTF